MGKWNFENQKLRELEERVKQLEISNQKLVAENKRLKEPAEKQDNGRSRINFLPEEQYEFLFGEICKNGKIVTTKDREVLCKRFNNFQRYITLTLMPTVKLINGTYQLAPPLMKDFDSIEWEVYEKVMRNVCNYVSLGKQIINEHKKGNEYDLSTAFQHGKVETFGDSFGTCISHAVRRY